MSKWVSFGAILLCALCWHKSVAAVEPAEIAGVGNQGAAAYGISADGSHVIGSFISPGGSHAFCWTQSGGMQDLGTLSGGAFSRAQGINADGSVVVGYSSSATSPFSAFRWTQANGMQDLGTLGGSTSIAYGVDASGAVVVGSAQTASSISHAFRWVQTGNTSGNMQDIDPNASSSSAATGVSGNGNVVAGWANNGSPNIHAFIWTPANGMQDLGTFGGPTSAATAVSSDGTAIVGWAATTATNHAFIKYTNSVGLRDLGVLPGYGNSVANGVNANGAVVVGMCQAGGTTKKAFRWTESTSMQSVEDWVIAKGGRPLAAGNNLESAYGVSADGNVVVGSGIINNQNQAFIAKAYDDPSIIGINDFYSSLRQPLIASSMLHDNLRNGLSIDLRNNAPRQGQFAFSAQAVYTDFVNNPDGDGIAGVFKLIYGINDDLRVGVGYIPGNERLETADGGKLKNYTDIFGALLSYGDYRGDGIHARISAAYGTGNADLTRSYLTGSGVDQSTGSMSVHQFGFITDVGYGIRILPKTLVTPRLGYEYVRTRLGAYRETGGTFPAEFDAVTVRSSFLRAGVQLQQDILDSLAVTAEGNYIYRLTGTGSSISGRIPELGDIGTFTETVALTRNWTELRAGLIYTPYWLSKNLRITFGYTANFAQGFDISSHRFDSGFIIYF
ncbi:MAG TPA: autotransporter domain-containing protein [Dissulfurispiraceae bacterium]|nr:autotransporter domain-containing protein [Dissulfurispiraceae bacterium]